MLDIEITPEKSIASDKWKIILGMTINQIIKILTENCETIKTVHLIYNEKEPLLCEYILNLSRDGIILYFDSISQRLKLIEINDLKRLKLRFCGNYFNNEPAVLPTVKQINDIFGVTHPGVYDTQSKLFKLHFSGLLFTFNIDYQVEVKPKLTHGIQSLQFTTGQSPIVNKIMIYNGQCAETALAPQIPSVCMKSDVYATKVKLVRDNARNSRKGLRLSLVTQSTLKTCFDLDQKEDYYADIYFDDTSQDIISALGSPCDVFYKSEESNLNENSMGNPFDYFYNYFTLGLDILFNADTHSASKFILHTNYPCHFNFNSYFMCNFELSLSSLESQEPLLVTSTSKWQEIKEFLSVKTQPAILHRSSSTNSINPFGPTFCYLYEDLIFEVMSNGHIASITFFN